jgi:hypothetical protein
MKRYDVGAHTDCLVKETNLLNEPRTAFISYFKRVLSKREAKEQKAIILLGL